MSKKETATNQSIPQVESKANLSKTRSQGPHFDTKTNFGNSKNNTVTSGVETLLIPQ